MVRLVDKILPPIEPPPSPLEVKTGDTIKLKRGWPKITVLGLRWRGLVIYRWFEKEKLYQARFLPISDTVAKNYK